MNFYRFRILSIVAVISSAIQGMPYPGYADIDTCGPNFSAIYDFKVGDVFERYSLKWNADSNQIVHYSKIVRKFTVVSVHKSGKAMTYDISGIEVRINGLWKGAETRSANNFQERLEYIDSATNFLNQCKGEIVPADTSGSDVIITRSKIQVAKGASDQFPLADDSSSLKWIGGVELGTYGDDGTLNPISDGSLKAVYAQELGLVSYSRQPGFFPFTNEVKLTGYIKNGRTVGIVTPDHVLLDASAIRNKKFDINPESGILSKTKIGAGYQVDVLGRESSVRKMAAKLYVFLKRP